MNMHAQPSQMTTFAALARNADAGWFRDELAFAWRTAQDEAVAAYEAWRRSPGRTAYAVYRAAQDRTDQAQDVLASATEVDHVRS
jgi:hypothetical protein